MTYVEYIALSSKDQFRYKTISFLKGLGNGFVGFFVSIGMFFVNLYKKLCRSFKEIKYAFVKGDIWTKLSFVFLGTSHIARGQIVKGVIYLIFEAAFITYLCMFGIASIQGMANLGTHQTYYQCSVDGTIVAEGFENIKFFDSGTASIYCNTINGLENVQIRGDNSSILLLFGVFAFVILFGFIFYYSSCIKSSITVQEKKESHQYISTCLDDLKELLDGKFYKVLLFLPIIGICIFTLLPLIDMILMAFTNYDTNHQYPASLFSWTGLSNFAQLFIGTGQNAKFGYTFVGVLLWTLVWAFFATFLNYFIGMIVAMIINKKGIKFKKLWRTFFVLSIAMPQFISLLTWNKFLSTGGMVEGILKALGLMAQGDKITVLEYATSARITIILVNLWVGVPYTILTTTGILMNIPADLYESAQIDGASPRKMYFKITLPYILFVTGPYLIQQFVSNINNFNVIFFLTGGAPLTQDYLNAGETDLLVTWLYKLTVNEQQYNLGSVIGIMVFIICSLFSLIAYKNSSSMKNEEDFA